MTGADGTPAAQPAPTLHRVAVWATFAVIVVVATVVRVPILHRVFGGRKAFRQSQTAWGIREFARHGIDLLHPPLPILGPPWHLWLEFPVPQAIASFFVRAGLSTPVAGRLLGLLSLQVTALLLFVLVRRWASVRAALLAVVLVEAVPLAAWFGADSLIEFTVTSFALASVLGLQRWLDSGRWWWWLAAASCSALAFMIKVTTGTAWMAPLLALAVLAARPDWRARWRRSALGLLAAPGAGLVGEAWWAHFSTVHNDASPFTRFQTPGADWAGVVGSISDRLSWKQNEIVIHRMGEAMTGHALVFVAAVVIVAVAARHRWFVLSLALVPVLGAELWFPLYRQHDYYPCAVLPAVAAVMAISIDTLATAATRRASRPRPALAGWLAGSVGVVAVLGVLALAWTSTFGHLVRTDLAQHPHLPRASLVLRENTPPSARIVMVGCSWDSRYLFNADRYGLMYMRAKFPPLSADYVATTYQYAMTCTTPAALHQLPQTLVYRPVAPGLYRIETP